MFGPSLLCVQSRLPSPRPRDLFPWKSPVGFLDLVKDDQSLPWDDRPADGKAEHLKETFRLDGALEKLIEAAVLFEVEVGDVLVIGLAKGPKEPGLPYLSR